MEGPQAVLVGGVGLRAPREQLRDDSVLASEAGRVESRRPLLFGVRAVDADAELAAADAGEELDDLNW